MSKTWPLLVLVSLKYWAEKRLLKTHLAFFYESNYTLGYFPLTRPVASRHMKTMSQFQPVIIKQIKESLNNKTWPIKTNLVYVHQLVWRPCRIVSKHQNNFTRRKC
jgi:hypothetical protein